MGNAYTGIASDFSALYWNPAGLAQAEYSEFHFGISNLSYQNTGTYYGSSSWYSNNGTTLNSLGFVYAAPTRRGSLSLALGYTRQSSFLSALSFSGFNTESSIMQAWAPDGEPYPPDITIGEELGLAVADTNTGRFVSPINGMLTQEGKVLEGGGIDNWSIGGAVDVAENVSVGATLTFLTGGYTYDRTYLEIDSRNVYAEFPFDMDQLIVEEYIRSDINGFNANLGMMYRVPGFLRLGMAVRTPTTYSVKEDFGRTADSYFDNGDILPVEGSYQSIGYGEYKVVSPWMFSGGLSLMILNFVFSGDIQFTDWTQLKFEDATPEVLALNNDIKEIFRPAANLRVGAEWNPLGLGLRLRAGAMYNQSPYRIDDAKTQGTYDYDQKYLTAGVGIPLGGFAMIDVAYAYGWWKTDRINYDATSRVDEDIKTHNVLATFSVRF
jgi:long-subunit fatty acid transport protein